MWFSYSFMQTFIVRCQSSVSVTGSFWLLSVLYLFVILVTVRSPPSITTAVTNWYFRLGFSPIVTYGLVRVLTAFEVSGHSVKPMYSAIVSFVRSKLTESLAVPYVYNTPASPVVTATVFFLLLLEFERAA